MNTINKLYNQGFRPDDQLKDLVNSQGLIAPTITNVDTGLSSSSNRPTGRALLDITNPLGAYLQTFQNPVALVCEKSTSKEGVETVVNARAVVLIKHPETKKLHVASAMYSGENSKSKYAKTVFKSAEYAEKQFFGYLGFWKNPLIWSCGAEFTPPAVEQVQAGN